MCGIVGAIANRDVTSFLIKGLKSLEYRGYDSAGIAAINSDGVLKRVRTLGKVNQLEAALGKEHLTGHKGIAHTRWATHGKPCEVNAHPHVSQDEIAVVHNGIIENHTELKDKLINEGYVFYSETDSEVSAHLIHYHYSKHKNLLEATRLAANEMIGAFAIGVIHEECTETLLCMKKGSPLVIGLAEGENFIASDPLALQDVANRFIFLEEEDIAEITLTEVNIYNKDGEAVSRPVEENLIVKQAIDKGEYRHFMIKEIFEQPQVMADTLQGRLTEKGMFVESFGDSAKDIFAKTKNIHIIACGTSYHAGLVAKYWLESVAGIACAVEVASEYRYRKVVVPDNTLFVTVSQSGETADTLAALKKAKEENYLATLGICNVPTSTLVRETDLVFLTRAGVEIGVASTKAFTTQLCGLMLLTMALIKDDKVHRRYAKSLIHMPVLSEKLLTLDKKIKEIAKDFVEKQHALFLGRGIEYPIALEGALKLKEISYIHAEAYPSGELKHGPLALVDSEMPVIAVAPNDDLLEKLKSNLEEVKARGGELYVFADEALGLKEAPGFHVISVPSIDPSIAPIVYTIPLQLLAYHVAVLKGTDVDQPRNLAKSVTVE